MRAFDISSWKDRTPSQGYFVSLKGMVIETGASFLEFSIRFENGEVIHDTFAGASKRRALYDRIHPELYHTIRSIANQVQRNKNLYGDYTFAKFPLGHAGYQLSVHTPTKKCWIRYPEFVRSFRPEDIYLRNPELPVLEAGRINHGIRRTIGRLGIELPDTPYEPLLRIFNR